MDVSFDGTEGLELLRHAAEIADEAKIDRWQLAVEWAALERMQVSPSVLRALMLTGAVQHRQETTRPTARQRSFRAIGNMAFPRGTCFVFTGDWRIERLVLERNHHTKETNAHAMKPRWHARERTLMFGEHVIKRFLVPAEAQEQILAAFEREGWPASVEPLMGRQRLHNAVNALNRGHRSRAVRFCRHRNGNVVTWMTE